LLAKENKEIIGKVFVFLIENEIYVLPNFAACLLYSKNFNQLVQANKSQKSTQDLTSKYHKNAKNVKKKHVV